MPDKISNFNPRAPCGARPVLIAVSWLAMEISIHAPLAGRDDDIDYAKYFVDTFQSTRPLRGATIIAVLLDKRNLTFQSTRPLRGATRSNHNDRYTAVFQSTRPLRGATT